MRRSQYDYDRQPHSGGRQHHGNQNGGSGIGWIVAILIVAGAGGGGFANSGFGHGSHPAPRSTVCTQYFKGGC